MRPREPGPDRKRRRAAWRDTVLAAIGVAGFVIARALHAPDPGVATRSLVLLIGALAIDWLVGLLVRELGTGPARAGRSRVPNEHFHDAVTALELASSEDAEELEQRLDLARTIRFAGLSATDSYFSLRPRLKAIASSTLERRGVTLDGGPDARARAVELLGARGFALIDPMQVAPTDRLAPGADLGAVVELLQRCEELA
jgi:hypothetical protein